MTRTMAKGREKIMGRVALCASRFLSTANWRLLTNRVRCFYYRSVLSSGLLQMPTSPSRSANDNVEESNGFTGILTPKRDKSNLAKRKQGATNSNKTTKLTKDKQIGVVEKSFVVEEKLGQQAQALAAAGG